MDNSVYKITDYNEFLKLLTQKKPIVIDFNANWCGPCQQIKSIFHQLALQFPKLLFLSINVDEAEKISQMLNVQALPTFVFIKKGEIIEKFTGANQDKLVYMVDNFSKSI